MAEEEVEEVEEEQLLSQNSIKWYQIHHLPHHHVNSLQAHHRSLSDTQIQLDDVVFPPTNHEGLHRSSSLPYHDTHQQEERHKSPFWRYDVNGLVTPPAPATPTYGGEVVTWVGLGYDYVRAKLTRFVSSLRYFANLGVANWSFSCVFGAAAALFVWWFYVAVRRRRQQLQVRNESRDHLILLIKEKDEKINHLLHQIAQLNQLLLSLHRDSSSRTGGGR